MTLEAEPLWVKAFTGFILVAWVWAWLRWILTPKESKDEVDISG